MTFKEKPDFSYNRLITISLVLSTILSANFSCNSFKLDRPNNKVIFANSGANEITYDTFDFHKDTAASRITFSYNHSKKEYRLIIDTASNLLWDVSFRKDTTRADYSKTLWINANDTILKAYEYILDKDSQDGEMLLYISPQVGLISQQSQVWQRGSFLKQHPDKNIDWQSLIFYSLLVDNRSKQ